MRVDLGKDRKSGGWEREQQGTQFKLVRVNKSVLEHYDPKVCQSKLEMGKYVLHAK